MLPKSFYTGPEEFIKMFNYERYFSKATFDRIHKNCSPIYSESFIFLNHERIFFNYS